MLLEMIFLYVLPLFSFPSMLPHAQVGGEYTIKEVKRASFRVLFIVCTRVACNGQTNALKLDWTELWQMGMQTGFSPLVRGSLRANNNRVIPSVNISEYYCYGVLSVMFFDTTEFAR